MTDQNFTTETIKGTGNFNQKTGSSTAPNKVAADNWQRNEAGGSEVKCARKGL